MRNYRQQCTMWVHQPRGMFKREIRTSKRIPRSVTMSRITIIEDKAEEKIKEALDDDYSCLVEVKTTHMFKGAVINVQNLTPRTLYKGNQLTIDVPGITINNRPYVPELPRPCRCVWEKIWYFFEAPVDDGYASIENPEVWKK
jgi:hypothetical protein